MLAQFCLQDFSYRVARDGVKVLDALGQLVSRHADLLQVADDILQRRRLGLVLRNDEDTGLLAHDLVGHRHRRHLLHAGMGENQVLDLGCANVEATANDDVFLAVKETDVVNVPHDEKVTCAAKAVWGERAYLQVRPLVIASKHIGSAVDQLAHLAGLRAFCTALIEQLHLYTLDVRGPLDARATPPRKVICPLGEIGHVSRPCKHRGAFGLSPGVQDFDVPAPLELLHAPARGLRRTRGDAAHAGEVKLIDVGQLEDHVQQGRHQQGEMHLVMHQLLEKQRHVQRVMQERRAPDGQRSQPGCHTGHVDHRRGRQHPVPFVQPGRQRDQVHLKEPVVVRHRAALGKGFGAGRPA
ncbi:hypothetical protein Y695_03006 [Hydrogenophaga sp. T4]|nr:hypothetical protein Y695_03006 [Hydrogenophaga sp. T4]